eukprot:gene6486-4671_t
MPPKTILFVKGGGGKSINLRDIRELVYDDSSHETPSNVRSSTSFRFQDFFYVYYFFSADRRIFDFVTVTLSTKKKAQETELLLLFSYSFFLIIISLYIYIIPLLSQVNHGSSSSSSSSILFYYRIIIHLLISNF